MSASPAIWAAYAWITASWYRATGIVTVGGSAMTTRAQVIVRSSRVHRFGDVCIEREISVNLVLEQQREHIGRVVRLLSRGSGNIAVVMLSRISHCRCRVRPAKAQLVVVGHLLLDHQPGAISLAFIL